MGIASNGWVDVRQLSPSQFRRLTGVTFGTFELMVAAVEHAETMKNKLGKPHRSSAPDRVLLCLDYLRDSPTYLRLGVNGGAAKVPPSGCKTGSRTS